MKGINLPSMMEIPGQSHQNIAVKDQTYAGYDSASEQSLFASYNAGKAVAPLAGKLLDQKYMEAIAPICNFQERIPSELLRYSKSKDTSSSRARINKHASTLTMTAG